MNFFFKLNNLKHYKFGIHHILLLLFIILIFQITLSYIHQISKKNIIDQTLEIFKTESAERIAHQSATALELILENTIYNDWRNLDETIRTIDITLNQIMLERNTNFTGLLIHKDDNLYLLDSGDEIYNFIKKKEGLTEIIEVGSAIYNDFMRVEKEIRESGRIVSYVEDELVFHIFVPFIINGEYWGVFYMEILSDINSIALEIKNAYGDTGAIFTALILFGLLAMYYISSYTVKERNDALKILYDEREIQLKERIEREKESTFTKRIYHAHHKAEKIMGFIKHDIHEMNHTNMEESKYIITRYSNFVSRVIYDMKSYDPPVHTIRSQIFKSQINDIFNFLVKHIFMRKSDDGMIYKFIFDLDETLPVIPINEYIMWEIFEPIIQNSIDHNPSRSLEIKLGTRYLKDEGEIVVRICDNGKGIDNELLEKTESGLQKIFLENTSTKSSPNKQGYGCFIAYHLSVKKCGWRLEAKNLSPQGCEFKFIIKV